jgi:hypothetical protein
VSSVAVLPPLRERLPERDPCVQDETWLISLCLDDREMIALMRHLHRVHGIVTVGQFDAAGWEVVNAYPKKIAREKLQRFYCDLGKKRLGVSARVPSGGAAVIAFPSAYA